ncbi:MAG: PadR family transcriptional regulator [Gemmatimonadota bacterium]
MSPRDIRITPSFLHLLLSLSEGPRHGYRMMQEIEERTDGRTRLGPSSLYYSLGRLEDAGLIREVEGPDDEDEPHGERRRYYALTDDGRRRLREETEALADIVAHARAQGLLG